MFKCACVLVGSALGLFVLEGSADACSMIRGCSSVALPSGEISLPRNAPGFPVSGTVPAGLDLLGPNNSQIALSVVGDTLIPASAPPLGSYTLSIPCDSGEPSTRVITFTQESPLPTLLGSISVGEAVVARLEVDGGAACVDEITAVSRQLAVTPSAELAAFGPLVQYRVTVDGNSWLGNRYLRVKFPDPNPPAAIDSGPLFLYAGCGKSRGLSPGKR